jgi:hypothetical protein
MWSSRLVDGIFTIVTSGWLLLLFPRANKVGSCHYRISYTKPMV